MSQLCQLATDWRGTIPAAGTMWEQKVDGWRALRFPGIDGRVRLWTRNGYPIEGTDHILHRLALMEQIADEPMVFDGEFQVGGTLAATKAWCERGWRAGGEAGTFYAFDCLTLVEWRAGGSDMPLIERKARLQALASALEADEGVSWEWREGSRGRDESGAVQVLADGWAATERDVLDEARRVWAAGGEGLVLKDALTPYQRNRNEAWQKVKQENTAKWLQRANLCFA